MTIPEHIREEAKSCYLNCEQMDSYGIIETIATALLAAEQRGMERAAEIAASPVAILNLPDEPAYDGDVRHVEKRVAEGIAAAIRKAREEPPT